MLCSSLNTVVNRLIENIHIKVFSKLKLSDNNNNIIVDKGFKFFYSIFDKLCPDK